MQQIIYTHKWSFAYHQALHTANKPLICFYCYMSFCCKPHSISHTRLHSGEKPHSCIVYGKVWSLHFRFNLHQHKQEKQVLAVHYLQKDILKMLITYFPSDCISHRSFMNVCTVARYSHTNHSLRCIYIFILETNCTLVVHVDRHAVSSQYLCHTCSNIQETRPTPPTVFTFTTSLINAIFDSFQK
jgi:hypothetical protein